MTYLPHLDYATSLPMGGRLLYSAPTLFRLTLASTFWAERYRAAIFWRAIFSAAGINNSVISRFAGAYGT